MSHHGITKRKKYGDIRAHIDLQHYSRVRDLPQEHMARRVAARHGEAVRHHSGVPDGAHILWIHLQS